METPPLIYCPLKPIIGPTGRGTGPHRECETPFVCSIRGMCHERYPEPGPVPIEEES